MNLISEYLKPWCIKDIQNEILKLSVCSNCLQIKGKYEHQLLCLTCQRKGTLNFYGASYSYSCNTHGRSSVRCCPYAGQSWLSCRKCKQLNLNSNSMSHVEFKPEYKLLFCFDNMNTYDICMNCRPDYIGYIFDTLKKMGIIHWTEADMNYVEPIDKEGNKIVGFHIKNLSRPYIFYIVKTPLGRLFEKSCTYRDNNSRRRIMKFPEKILIKIKERFRLSPWWWFDSHELEIFEKAL